jgi:hypothetical protein
MWAFDIVGSVEMTFEEWYKKTFEADYYAAHQTYAAYLKDAWNAAKPQWQPIESAPKDGTEIILCALDSVFVGVWIGKENYRGEIGGMT